MRDLVVLVVLVGLILLCLKLIGCFDDGEEASGTSSDGDVETAVAEDEGPGGGSEESKPEVAGREDVEAAIRAVSSGATPANLERIRELAAAARGELAELATAVLGASSGSPVARWHGLSRMYEDVSLDVGVRTAIRDLAVKAARAAVQQPGQSLAYEVVAGDSLVRISGKLKKNNGLRVNAGILRWVNGITGDLIRPQQVLRAPREPVSLWISKQLFVLRVYIGDGLLAEYPVGLGRDDKTPAGTFTTKRPLVKPPWANPETGRLVHFGEEGYAIGTRWIGFEPNGPHVGLGIHGTDEPDSIGKAESLGCVRLRNEQVEELAELVPSGTTVTIVEGTRR